MKSNARDENIREPFIWDIAANDKYRTSWIKPIFSTYKNVVPLSIQINDPESVFNCYKELLLL